MCCIYYRGGIFTDLIRKLEEFSTWAAIVGWVTVISGAIEAILGLFAFIIGALPGVITLIMGIKLLGARDRAKNIVLSQDYDEHQMVLLIQEMTSYFKIQGILIIIGVILFVLLGVTGFIAYI
ncbi:DUF5362 family protein [Thermosediminibacter litoriperuensis]|uniref:DUF5362 family protein n=1 Tax=Thermosediminibacter litoriperuensis TaxID=291989 RepID=UPI001478CB11|nr:DUF5362 family protein [Thermosediminibacter litoriperuensis]